MQKRLALIATFSITCVLALSAQSSPYWGATLGLNLSKPKISNLHTGFRLGGLIGYDLSSHDHRPYLEAELLLSEKGWNDKTGMNTEGNSDAIGTYYCHAYYLEVPLRFGWKWAPSDRFALKVGLGPYLAYGLWGKLGLKDPNGDDVSKDEYNIPKHLFGNIYRRFDWGLGGKVGMELRGHWSIDLGYEASFLRSEKHTTIFPHKDRSWVISATYIF